MFETNPAIYIYFYAWVDHIFSLSYRKLFTKRQWINSSPIN